MYYINLSDADCEDEDLRLVSGSETAGIVQICYNGIWNYVCDDLWGDTEAQVVCRILGLPYECEHNTM